MINITDKSKCCGCTACSSVCPKGCIVLQPDEEGFVYPHVDVSLCVNCGRCDSVCQFVTDKVTNHTSIIAYAARSVDNENRKRSSSGGIFYLLACHVIQAGGIVIGAAYDENMRVHHIFASSLEDIELLRTSKYAQSDLGNTFQRVKTMLQAGRLVLFSGTGCQVNGLNRFLDKQYENLFTVEIVCAGVASPYILYKHLQETTAAVQQSLQQRSIYGLRLVKLNMRDKSTSWSRYSCAYHYEYSTGCETTSTYQLTRDKYHDVFLRGYNALLFSRPSCYSCPAKLDFSSADIILGDFWHIEEILPEWNDNMGTSAVIIRTEQGQALFRSIQVTHQKVEMDVLRRFNKAMFSSHPIPLGYHNKKNLRAELYQRIANGCSLSASVAELTHIPVSYKVWRKIKKLLGLYR